MYEPSPALSTHAYLWITHAERDPNEVSEIMQVSPTRMRVKAQKDVFSHWFLASEEHLSTKTVAAETHLKWVLDAMGDRPAEKVAKLKELGFGVDLRVRIIMRSGTSISFQLPPKILPRLAELDVLFMCDLDCVPEDTKGWD